MDVILYLNIYMFPVILLVIIINSMWKNPIQTAVDRQYRYLMELTITVLVLGLLSWLVNGQTFVLARPAAWISNMAYFILVPCVSLLWMNFVCFYVYRKTLLHIPRARQLLLLLPLAAYCAILLSSPLTDWIFTINGENCYERGAFFFLPYLLDYIYMALTLIVGVVAALTEKSQHRKKPYILICVLTCLSFGAAALQANIPGMQIALPCIALADAVFFVYLQGENITTDGLTGINNRGCFDSYLSNQLKQPERRRSLCLFVMDMDNLKMINDT